MRDIYFHSIIIESMMTLPLLIPSGFLFLTKFRLLLTIRWIMRIRSQPISDRLASGKSSDASFVPVNRLAMTIPSACALSTTGGLLLVLRFNPAS